MFAPLFGVISVAAITAFNIGFLILNILQGKPYFAAFSGASATFSLICCLDIIVRNSRRAINLHVEVGK